MGTRGSGCGLSKGFATASCASTDDGSVYCVDTDCVFKESGNVEAVCDSVGHSGVAPGHD